MTWWLKKMKGLMVDFAKKSHNNLLMDMLTARGVAVADDRLVKDLSRVFEEYQTVVGSSDQPVKPVGEVMTVKKVSLEDPGDAMKSNLMEDSKIPASVAQEKIEDIQTAMGSMDDLIEDESGKLVGLKVQTSSIRER